jgi:3-hydroxyisobutyrate dehydrogenase-like beta-hydroxyacid dehydrogenase
MQSKPAVIGFMGVGAIGRPMAERMLAEHPVIICDVSSHAREYFAGKAETVVSAEDLGNRADIVFACLPSLQSYRDAVLSPGGLVSGKQLRTFVHVGTTGPELTREMAEACRARGVSLIDAPITGGPSRARAGHLGVMAAGEPDAFAEVEPLIRTYATAITYLGPQPGQAQIMKLINNVLSAANLAVASEVLVLGAKAGLDPVQMLEVLNAGTGQNSATLTKIPDHILPRTFDYGGRLEVVHKDLASMVRQADHFGLSAPLSRMIEATYRTAMSDEGADADMTTVIRHMERSAGVEVVGTVN